MLKDYSGFTLAQMILIYQSGCASMEGRKNIPPKTKREYREIGNDIRLRLMKLEEEGYTLWDKIYPKGAIVIILGGQNQGVVQELNLVKKEIIVVPDKQIQSGVTTISLPINKLQLKYVNN